MRSAIFNFLLAALSAACGGATAVVSASANRPVVTAVHEIQGNAAASPMEGQDVTIRGLVTGDFQSGDADNRNELRGFYVQEEFPDGDPVTSDGIFVFDGRRPAVDVNVGDRVSVKGIVKEYFGETQISATRVVLLAAGAGAVREIDVELPATATVLNNDGEPIADLERYEGMLVRFPQTLTVTHLRDLERFGEILLSQNGRLWIFTDDHEPDVAGYAAYLEQTAARSIMLDDGLSRQNANPIRYLTPLSSSSAPYPAIRVGDTTKELTGNIRFARGSGASGTETYRLVPSAEPTFTPSNPRPAVPPDVGNALRVASFNLDNYFTTIDAGENICGPSGNGRCRGADNQEEFDRQHAKVITALAALDADIVALTEAENKASESLQILVDGLNAVVGTGGYAFVDTGIIGTDAIKVGFLYKPASVVPAGAFAVLDSGVDQRFDSTRNRPSLAQSFSQISDGAVLTIAVSHLKSKSSSCESVGDPKRFDGQSHCNITRSDAAAALADWLKTDPTSSGDPDFLITGDLNAHMREDPIRRLEAAGYDNLILQFTGTEGYSYLFEGRSGTLDHALASQSLSPQVTGVAEWHVNADEAPVQDYQLEFGRDPAIFDGSAPYRFSDHDPIIIGLDLTR